MSNYRVRQVLALGAMPEPQLRFLVALATWLTDDTRTARVAFSTLAAKTGNSEKTVKKARRDLEAAGRLASEPGCGRGNLTTWTVLCLPAKEGSEITPLCGDGKEGSETTPLSPAADPGKGGTSAPEKGVAGPHKRGYPQAADQQEHDRKLNLLAKPSSSPSVADAARAVVPDATDDEIETYAREIERKWKPDNPARYIQGFPAATIMEAITAGRRRGNSGRPSDMQFRDLCPRCSQPHRDAASCGATPSAEPAERKPPKLAAVQPPEGQACLYDGCRMSAAPINSDGYHEICRRFARIKGVLGDSPPQAQPAAS